MKLVVSVIRNIKLGTVTENINTQFSLGEAQSTKNTCGSPEWKGDTYCDDENNNNGCEFDGGDCCGSDIDKTFCIVCACMEPDEGSGDGGDGENGGDGNDGGDTGGCEYPYYQGDGFCDDENNNNGCTFDGGDCCGDNVDKTYCYECECKAGFFNLG